MNTGSASQGKDFGMLKVKVGLMQEISSRVCGESFTHLVSPFLYFNWISYTKAYGFQDSAQ